eukprot:TRINITY_DN3691_c0_g1_i8.p1 TRINITY_DN3691_c0_g1~~TRINITY_DN3691_c0_g1_i8.p1  ORF type:complete len:139 (-),score=10.30 TRINITY_DN3691_c0_g1_i8:102-518(-)
MLAIAVSFASSTLSIMNFLIFCPHPSLVPSITVQPTAGTHKLKMVVTGKKCVGTPVTVYRYSYCWRCSYKIEGAWSHHPNFNNSSFSSILYCEIELLGCLFLYRIFESFLYKVKRTFASSKISWNFSLIYACLQSHSI